MGRGRGWGRRAPARRAAGVLCAAALSLVVAAPATAATLPQRLDAIVRANPIASDTSVVAYDVATQTVLYQYQPRRVVAPASNQKLYTTAALLQALGPDYRFSTRLALRGTQVGGRFEGDAYLVGGGDPTLSTPQFGRKNFGGRAANLALLAQPLEARGIVRITGRLVVDDSFLDQARYVAAWPSRFRFVEAPALGGLTVNHGYFGAHLGGKATRDPAIWSGDVLRSLLLQRGIVVDGPVVAGALAPDAEPVATVQSPPLHQVLRFMNTTSDNFTAELLLKDLGRIATGVGSTTNGVGVELNALHHLGIDLARVRIADGSGLSSTDRTTADDLASLVNVLDRNPLWGADFVDELAVNGRVGTLRKRLRGAGMRDRVHAKTGTLNETSALTGFATRDDRRRIGFAIVTYVPHGRINYARARKLQDAVVATLVR